MWVAFLLMLVIAAASGCAGMILYLIVACFQASATWTIVGLIIFVALTILIYIFYPQD
jgi:hypothetical protein